MLLIIIIMIIIINNFYIALDFGALSALQINTVFFKQLRVLDSGSHILTTVNALIEKYRPQHRDHCPALFDKCVGSFKSPDRVSRNWTYGLTSLSEKTRRSNHLQMLEQRQLLLLNYFKTLSVGR